MARLHSELVLGLTDHVSGPARRIDQNLENLRQQQMRNQAMFDRHRNAMLGTGLAAYAMARGLAAPVQASIEFSTQLEDIRQKADLSSEAMERMGRAARDIGLDTAQGAGNVTGAIDSMIGSGAVTPEQAQEIATPLGKAATAYRADPTDMANATSAMALQMGITAEQIEKAYDMMAEGGKMGSFELKDMAAEFPNVLAQANSLGITGEKGLASIIAWLQIARRGTADASSAANNFSNFMGKVLAPDSIKNFGEAGVDIVGEMNRAVEAGVDPIEHVVGILNGLTEGQRDKLGEFFADTQVTNFLLQATKALQDYQTIRDEALSADGTVERDFLARMETPQAKVDRFMASVENLNIAIGNSLVPALTEFAESVTPMIDGVADFVDANGELVAAVVEITAALIGLRMLAAGSGMLGAVLGMNGSGPAIAGPGSPTGKVKPSGGGTLLLGAPWIAEQIGTQIFDAINGDGATAQSKAVTEGAWDRTAARFAAMWGSSQYDTGLISPGAEGSPDAERMAALRADIATLEGAKLPVTPPELAFMRAELEELEAKALESGQAAGQNLADGIGSQGPVMNAEMAQIMAQLRATVESGIVIPVTLGPNLGAIAPPSGPRIGAQAPAPVQQNNTVGDVHVNVTNSNASPYQIGRQVGQQVADRLNAAHSNGGM